MLPYAMRAGLHRVRSRLERGARRVLLGGRPSWRRRPNALPWLDRPDALAVLGRAVARGRVPAADAPLLERWVREGWLVVDDAVDLRDVDAMVATLDGLWTASAPIPHLELLDLRETPDAPPRAMSHAAVLALDPERRRRVREASDWRIHGFHYVNAAARRLFGAPRLRRLASLVLGRRARPIAAINFMTGSQQRLHQDMAVFHIYPHNHLVGAWIACEDIRPESGPLVLYPGSHRAPLFSGFTDYPQTNLRTADDETAARYQAWVEALAARHERREFLARKGQVLFWHGMLVHGGAPVRRRGATRRSMVIHYTVRGADRAREVEGPFNW
jgi:phytanoyl-CoA hydroxylase